MSRKQDLRILATYANAPDKFPACNVPVSFVAKIMQKDSCFVREGIEAGWLPIGFAKRSEGGGRRSYYISPKLLWEVTGILYDPNQ